jgi:hypothetical protein
MIKYKNNELIQCLKEEILFKDEAPRYRYNEVKEDGKIIDLKKL